MFGHFPELIIILVIALIVFGPEKLPEVAANAGKMMREVRAAFDTAMNPVNHEAEDNFSEYYYDALARSGDDVPEMEGSHMMTEEGHEIEPIEVTTLAPESQTAATQEPPDGEKP